MQTKPPRTKSPHQYTKTTKKRPSRSYTKTYSYSRSTKAYSYRATMKPRSYSLTTPTMHSPDRKMATEKPNKKSPPKRNSNNKETIKRLINSRQRIPLRRNTR